MHINLRIKKLGGTTSKLNPVLLGNLVAVAAIKEYPHY